MAVLAITATAPLSERLALPLAAVLLAAGGVLSVPPRLLDVLTFFALLLGLAGAGRRLTRFLLPDEAPLSVGVAGFTAAVAVGTLPAYLLGHLGLLRPAYYLSAVAVLILSTLLLPLPDRQEQEGNGDPPPLPRSAIERVETALLLTAAAALGLGLLSTAWRLRFEPVGAFGGDDVSYHMGAVATWLRHGDLRMMKFEFGDRSTAFYPILAEITSWALLAPFRDSDVAARWTQLPFALFSFLALAALGRRLGLSRRASAFAVLFYASIHHILPVLTYTAGNDHSTSFFTLAALDGALATSRRPTRGRAVMTGLALGLLVGTKYIGLFYGATLALVLALLLLAHPEHRALFTTGEGRRRLLTLTGILLGAGLLAGGYTYLRNLWTLGNPVFPAPLRLLGHELCRGWETATLAYRRTRPSFHLEVWPYLTDRSDLFGPLFPYTLLPAALLAPLVALLRWGREGARRLETTVVVLLPLVFFLEFLKLMDDHRDDRYWISGLGLAALGFAWLTERLGRRAGAALRALLLVLLLHQINKLIGLSHTHEAILIVLLLPLATVIAFWREPPHLLPARRAGLLLATALGLCLLSASPFFAREIETYQSLKLRNRPAALALEEAVGQGGAKVAYVAFNQPYLYFGSRLQNDVQILPTHWDFASQYYTWVGNAEFPFDQPDFRRWWRTLVALDIRFVVLRLAGGEEPYRGWIRAHPDRFQPIYQETDEVYRLVR